MLKNSFRIGNRKFIVLKNKLLLGVVVLVSILTLGSIVSAYYSQKVTNGISESILRLHVVANSDSDEDQALKRQIRDDILVYMKENMNKDSTLEESKSFIKENIPGIEEIAMNEINQRGMSYGAKAFLGDYDFPTKVYGDIALPSGSYQALKVVLGNGSGANWWCVLFPPLCFVDATHGTIPDSVKNDLKNVLNEDEYALVTTADNEEDIPIQLKFKLVEFFEDGKIQFTGMVKRLFN